MIFRNVLVAPAPLRNRIWRNDIEIRDVLNTNGKAMVLHGSNVLVDLACVFVSWTTLLSIDVLRGTFVVSRGWFRNSRFDFSWSCGWLSRGFLIQPLDTTIVTWRFLRDRRGVCGTFSVSRGWFRISRLDFSWSCVRLSRGFLIRPLDALIVTWGPLESSSSSCRSPTPILLIWSVCGRVAVRMMMSCYPDRSWGVSC